MALSEAWGNIRSNYSFHLSVSGGRASRFFYLTLYYAIFIFFRWGDRYKRALEWLKATGLSDRPVDVETPDGVRLRLDLHTAFDPLYSIVGQGDYEREPGFRPEPGQTVIDLGANLGVFATLAAKCVGPEGKVIAFEPHPGNFERLRTNAAQNGFSWLTCIQAAVGEKEGTANLFIHDRGINHSLVRGSGASVAVRVRTVDEVVRELGLTRVDLIKIDIEGFVPEALRGSVETIRRFRPRLTLERDAGPSDEILNAFFRAEGYEFKDWRCMTYAWPVNLNYSSSRSSPS